MRANSQLIVANWNSQIRKKKKIPEVTRYAKSRETTDRKVTRIRGSQIEFKWISWSRLFRRKTRISL